QRNRLLQNIKSGHRVAEAAIEPWTEKMIALGNKIVSDRFRLIGELAGLLAPIYREYSGSNDEVRITIESQVQPHHGEEAYWTALKNLKQRERQLGVSLVGPHRDDLNISINDRDLRDYGSRGEHKSVLIALRLAELQFLKQKREETPVFLLDDCFSELDETRERGVFFSFHGLGQMFLTSPRELGFLEEAVSSEISKYRVQNGVIEPL
ncbi:MAG TPA: hypothetical protein VGA99_08195, partial [bacterium]